MGQVYTETPSSSHGLVVESDIETNHSSLLINEAEDAYPMGEDRDDSAFYNLKPIILAKNEHWKCDQRYRLDLHAFGIDSYIFCHSQQRLTILFLRILFAVA